jgi:hypothetical protein
MQHGYSYAAEQAIVVVCSWRQWPLETRFTLFRLETNLVLFIA